MALSKPQVRHTGSHPAHTGEGLDPPGHRTALSQSQPVSNSKFNLYGLFKADNKINDIFFISLYQEWLQVLVLLSSSYRHG